MISIARDKTKNGKRWRDGKMIKRRSYKADPMA